MNISNDGVNRQLFEKCGAWWVSDTVFNECRKGFYPTAFSMWNVFSPCFDWMGLVADQFKNTEVNSCSSSTGWWYLSPARGADEVETQSFLHLWCGYQCSPNPAADSIAQPFWKSWKTWGHIIPPPWAGIGHLLGSSCPLECPVLAGMPSLALLVCCSLGARSIAHPLIPLYITLSGNKNQIETQSPSIITNPEDRLW